MIIYNPIISGSAVLSASLTVSGSTKLNGTLNLGNNSLTASKALITGTNGLILSGLTSNATSYYLTVDNTTGKVYKSTSTPAGSAGSSGTAGSAGSSGFINFTRGIVYC